MNVAIAPRAEIAAPPSDVMPLGRLLRAYLVEAKYECLRMLRTVAFAVPFLVLPVVIYLLFGIVLGGEEVRKPGVANYVFSGFCVFAVMGPGLFGIGCSLAIERSAGLLKLKRALPAPPGANLLAKMAMSMFFAALAVLPVMVVALAVGTITLKASTIALMFPVLVLGSLPFCAIGLFIGTRASGSAAPAITNLIYLPMMWLSGMFIPLPKFLEKWVVIWPAFHLDQVALRVAGVKGFQFLPTSVCIGVLVAFTVVFGGVAIRQLARKG